MENTIEKEQSFNIELPECGDEISLARMHIQSWKETYVTPESGLTEGEVDEMLGHMLRDTSFRKNTILESLSHPDKVLYRVVKNASGDIVGFLHGSKHKDHNELDAIYLLNEAKGSGTGGRLMRIFLAWIDATVPTYLQVFCFNESALGFYEKYGFTKTDTKLPLYKEMFPVVEMIRPSDLEKY